MNGEGLLLSLSGADLRKEACGFALDPDLTPEAVHRRVCEFRKRMLRGLSLHLKALPAPPLKELVRRIEGLRGRRA
jgi:hypothetical protein